MAELEWKRLCVGYFYTDIGNTHVRAIQCAEGWDLQFSEETENRYRVRHVLCKTLEEAQAVAAAWKGF